MAIKLTTKASGELKTLMGKEVESKRLTAQAALRLMVQGGGCSGFTYRMGFDEAQKPGDRVFEVEGIKVLVDEKSYLYLNGTEIDFQDGLMGRGFVFNNPNATGTCGCGQSFNA
jgi:iron-sulfur cluster assembly protein